MYSFAQSRPWLYIAGLFRNWRECIVGLLHFWKFERAPVAKKSVLLIEFNPFHGETLPGYVHYFQELGYEVTVITRYVSYSDSPFVRMEKKPRHICMTIWGMRHFLKSRDARDFDFILYNSAHLYLNEYRYHGRASAFLGGEVFGGRYGFALIEHSLKPGADLEYFQRLPEEAPDKQNLFRRSFVLTKQVVDGHQIPMLNPCYFGKVRHEHQLNAKRIFLTIGNVSSGSRNFKQLFDAIEQLGDNDEFEMWIIGRILDEELVHTIPSCVKVLGRLNFAEMYNRIEQADFFLPLLDPKTQSLYLQGCTSGSRQLILGFCIPPVIHGTFARYYGFPVESCLAYNDGASFATALRRALLMNDEEYGHTRVCLEALRKKVEMTSLNNLKQMLVANDSSIQHL